MEGDVEIVPGVFLIPHKDVNLSEIGKKNNMYLKKRWKWEADNFAHEQSLVFKTDEGLVIFNSCSHGGADQIIREVSKTFPDETPGLCGTADWGCGDTGCTWRKGD